MVTWVKALGFPREGSNPILVDVNFSYFFNIKFVFSVIFKLSATCFFFV